MTNKLPITKAIRKDWSLRFFNSSGSKIEIDGIASDDAMILYYLLTKIEFIKVREFVEKHQGGILNVG